MSIAALISGAGSFLQSPTGQQLISTGIQALGRRPGPMGLPPPAAFTGAAFQTGQFGLPLGVVGGRRGRVGRFSGQAIPPGTKEKISRSGQIILSEVRRGRGLTARDLRGFRRTVNLIRSVGMRPKGLSGGRGGFKRRRKA